MSSLAYDNLISRSDAATLQGAKPTVKGGVKMPIATLKAGQKKKKKGGK